MPNSFFPEALLSHIPSGYSEVTYRNKKYGVSRSDFAAGQSTKIYAQELGGNDIISFNYYRTKVGGQLKPCEMPEQKVWKFLTEMQPV